MYFLNSKMYITKVNQNNGYRRKITFFDNKEDEHVLLLRSLKKLSDSNFHLFRAL